MSQTREDSSSINGQDAETLSPGMFKKVFDSTDPYFCKDQSSLWNGTDTNSPQTPIPQSMPPPKRSSFSVLNRLRRRSVASNVASTSTLPSISSSSVRSQESNVTLPIRPMPINVAVARTLPWVEIPQRQGHRAPGNLIKPVELRDLKELIRRRYALDVEIWEMRDVYESRRSKVREKMAKADATLKQIHNIVLEMNNSDLFEDPKDHKKLQMIKNMLDKPGKRDWASNPPWVVAPAEISQRTNDYFEDEFEDEFDDYY